MRKHIFSLAFALLIPALLYTASRAIVGNVDSNRALERSATAPAEPAASQTGKPVPYLPPEGLRGPGEVTELTRENQFLVREQLRGHKQPVFELVYSSQDPRSKSMESWFTQAAKRNPLVTFIKLDTTKIAVQTPTPTLRLSIPRPARDFSRTGYMSDAELDKFLNDGLKTWTPIQHQHRQNLQHLPLPHFHYWPAPIPGALPIKPLILAAGQTGNGSITVPPGVARGYGNYPDGTPCIGTPKDPTRQPDKHFNPCDSKPLLPENIPGPYPPVVAPPVNVTAPGGQTVPEVKPAEPDRRAGQFAPYEDGTPCIGRPKDLSRRPNKETNPCVAEPSGEASEAGGKHEPIRSGDGAAETDRAPAVPTPGPVFITPTPYPDGTPCIGPRPDPTRPPDVASNPCRGNPDGKPRSPVYRLIRDKQ